MTSLGPVVYAFFERHLKAEKGLSPASVRSYSDTLRLFLAFIADQRHRPITRLAIQDLTAERVRQFLGHLEAERGNHIRTRNQRDPAPWIRASVKGNLFDLGSGGRTDAP